MNRPEFAISEILDQYIRRNFERLRDFLAAETPLLNFKPYEASFTATGTFKVKHTLGFQPRDIIQTSLTGHGAVQYNYSNFTATELDLTVTGTVSSSNPTKVRFLVGTLEA